MDRGVVAAAVVRLIVVVRAAVAAVTARAAGGLAAPAALGVASVTATLFDLWGQLSAASALLTLPIAVWEFSLGVYLIVKGFKPSPITAAMATA